MPRRLRTFPWLAAILLGGLLARLCLGGLSGWGVAALVIAAVWFCIEAVRWLLAPGGKPRGAAPFPDSPAPATSRQNGAAVDAPSPSLVYFLSEMREADETAILNCVASALGLPRRDEGVLFVAPFSPPDEGKSEAHLRHYMVRVPDGIFAVLVSSRPYIDDPKGFAQGSIRDKRLRSAVERHVAWLSVDAMGETDGSEAGRDAYRTIGKILASMAGPDCLAIYCPELQRCNEFDPCLIETLGGEDPLGLFDEPTFEPVIEIADNHPKMAAAVREAVERWPEFAAAFAASLPEDRERFIVKAEFREERKSEFMWVSVQEIGGGTVTGVLMNDPHELLDVHRGAVVSFSLEQLNDWIYPGRGGSHIGGFTLDVLADDGEP